MHTKDKTLIDEAISIMLKYDSINYAKKRAAELLSKAWGEVSQFLPDSDAKKRIKEIVGIFGDRNI